MSPAVSPWEEWKPGHNPYRRTAFQVLGISPAEKGRAAIRTLIGKRRKRIRSAPERYPLFGEQLDEADVNEAEHRILDPEARLYDELCTHRPRRSSIDLGSLPAQLAEITPQVPDAVASPVPARLVRLVRPLSSRTFPPVGR